MFKHRTSKKKKKVKITIFFSILSDGYEDSSSTEGEIVYIRFVEENPVYILLE